MSGTTVEECVIIFLCCPPTACFGLCLVGIVAACKFAVAADPAKSVEQSRGPIVMVWAMDFVNT